MSVSIYIKMFHLHNSFFTAVGIYVNILIRRSWGRTHRKHKDNLSTLVIYVNNSTVIYIHVLGIQIKHVRNRSGLTHTHASGAACYGTFLIKPF